MGKLKSVAVVLGLLAVVGYGASANQSAKTQLLNAPSPTLAATVTPVATAIVTPTPSPTLSPSPSFTPTPTPSLRPTPTKTPYQTAKPAAQEGLSNDNYYKNVDGNSVHAPAYSNTVPAGASARCRDGTYSFSQNRRGTCSHHGGVAEWL